jgi:hypothetical protein
VKRKRQTSGGTFRVWEGYWGAQGSRMVDGIINANTKIFESQNEKF